MAFRRCVAVVSAFALLLGVATVVSTPARAGSVVKIAKLFSWGSYGEAACTDNSGLPAPVAMPAGVQPVTVASGVFHALVIGSDNKLYGCGAGHAGALDPSGANLDTFTTIPLPPGVIPKSVAAGRYASFVIDTTGRLWSWGTNEWWLLGTSNQESEKHTTPTEVVFPAGVTISAISVADHNVAALAADGSVYEWGVLQVPTGDSSDLVFHGTPTKRVTLPVRMVAVATGYLRVTTLGADGKVYDWGSSGPAGGRGSADDVKDYADYIAPAALTMPGNRPIKAIVAGPGHTMALATDGTVIGWGDDQFGQLGRGSGDQYQFTPAVTALPAGHETITGLATNQWVTFLVGTNAVYGTGYRMLGDPAIPIEQTVRTFTALHADFGANPVITAGGGVIYALAAGYALVPTFTVAAPPTLVLPNQPLSYQFVVKAYPSGTFSLGAGAPSWLTIDPMTGTLAGTVPSSPDSFDFSVAYTSSAGTSVAGPFHVRVGQPQPVAGVVQDADRAAVTGALVDVCATTCTSTTSGAGGAWSVQLPEGSDVVVTARGAGTGAAPVTLKAGKVPAGGLHDLTLQLSPFTLLPASVGVGNRVDTGGPGTTPTVHYLSKVPVSGSGCAGGFGVTTVVARTIGGGPYTYRYAIMNDPSGSGQYRGSLDPLYPLHGPAQLTQTIHCPKPGGFSVPKVLAPHTSGRQAHSALDTADKIATFVYNNGPKLLEASNKLGTAIDLAKAAIDWNCETSKAAAKAAIGLALDPLVDVVVEDVTAAMIELELPLAFGNPVAFLVIAAITPLVVKYVVDQLAESLVSAAVDALAGDCPEEEDKPEPNILIDPSGTVQDTNGNLIVGATVTIKRADTAAGPFTTVPADSAGIEPHVNPETTGADGMFHWDVSAGYYTVSATAPGCTAADGGDTATIGPMQVPPPRLGLVIEMTCANQKPAARPSVTALSRSSGPRTAGTQIGITGSGFTPSTVVAAGATLIDPVFISATDLRITLPAGSGWTPLTVTTAGGTSAVTAASRYFFGAAPAITALSAHSGSSLGATSLTVTGRGFSGATSVRFGQSAGTGVKVLSDTELTVVVPRHALGRADVVVTNPAGTSTASVPARYTYVATKYAAPQTIAKATAVGSRAAKVSLTPRAGDLLVASVAADGPSGAQRSVVGGGLTWRLVKRASAARGVAEIWVARAGATKKITVTASLAAKGTVRKPYRLLLGVTAYGTQDGYGAVAALARSTKTPAVTLRATRANSTIRAVAVDWTRSAVVRVSSGIATGTVYRDSHGATYWLGGSTRLSSARGQVRGISLTSGHTDRWSLVAIEIVGRRVN